MLLMAKMKSSTPKECFYFLRVCFFRGSSLLTGLDKCLSVTCYAQSTKLSVNTGVTKKKKC